MRLDHDHVRTLAHAFETDEGDGKIFKIDVEFMVLALRRLSFWESGLLSKALTKALTKGADGARLSAEQRVLLALFAHRGGTE